MKQILQELTKLFEELLGFQYSTDTQLQDTWSLTTFKETPHNNYSGFELYIDLRFADIEAYSELVTPDFQRALNTILYEILEINWSSATNTAEYRLYKEQSRQIQ